MATPKPWERDWSAAAPPTDATAAVAPKPWERDWNAPATPAPGSAKDNAFARVMVPMGETLYESPLATVLRAFVGNHPSDPDVLAHTYSALPSPTLQDEARRLNTDLGVGQIPGGVPARRPIDMLPPAERQLYQPDWARLTAPEQAFTRQRFEQGQAELAHNIGPQEELIRQGREAIGEPHGLGQHLLEIAGGMAGGMAGDPTMLVAPELAVAPRVVAGRRPLVQIAENVATRAATGAAENVAAGVPTVPLWMQGAMDRRGLTPEQAAGEMGRSLEFAALIGTVLPNAGAGIRAIVERVARLRGKPAERVTVGDVQDSVGEIAVDEQTKRILEASGITTPDDPRYARAAAQVQDIMERRAASQAALRTEGGATRQAEVNLDADAAAEAAAKPAPVDPLAAEAARVQSEAARPPQPDVLYATPPRPEGQPYQTAPATPAQMADPGIQAGIDRQNAADASVQKAFDQADLQQRRGPEYQQQRAATEAAYAAEQHIAALQQRIGEDPAALVQRQFGVAPDQFKALSDDARERLVAAAQRQVQAETPSGRTLHTADDAMSAPEGAPYDPASQPNRVRPDTQTQRGYETTTAPEQPTRAAIESDQVGAYDRPASGNSDRPFPGRDEGLTPEQQALFEDRARAQAEAARQASEEDLLRQWREREEATRRGEQQQSDPGNRQRRAAESEYTGRNDFSNTPGPLKEGRFETDQHGYVRSDKGGPIRFSDAKQAARWIVNVGHKQSRDQFFEIDVHPAETGRNADKTTYTVKESGRGSENVTSQMPDVNRDEVGRERGIFGPVYRQYRGDAQGAVDRLTKEGSGVAVAALNHREMGPIDLVHSDPTRKTQGDNGGLVHIAAKHPEVLPHLQRLLDSMTVTKREKGRVTLESPTHKAVVRTGDTEGARKWLLTLHAKDKAKSPAGPLRTTDAQRTPEGAGSTAPPATGRDAKVGDQADVGKAADTLSGGGGGKLYSNPLDPRAIRDLYGPLFRGLFKWADRDIDAWHDDILRWKEALRSSSSLKNPLTAAADFLRTMWYSNDGVLQMLANRFNESRKEGDGFVRTMYDRMRPGNEPNKAITEIRRMFFAPPGRTADAGTARTYGEAVEMNYGNRVNRLGQILEPFRGMTRQEMRAALEQIGQKVRSGVIRDGASKIDSAAAAIRDLLKEHYSYLKESGMDIGEVRSGYLPRVLDTEAVFKDPKGFLHAAERLYRLEGASPADAKELAQAWHDRVYDADLGFRADANDFVQTGSGTGVKYEKSRTFSKRADEMLKAFYLQNPADILPVYFLGTARRAEWVRRMGAKLERWQEMKQAIKDSGAGGELGTVVGAIQSATGSFAPPSRGGVRGLLNGMRLWSALAFLPRATWSSLTEPLVAAMRTGNAGDAIRAYGLTMRDLLDRATNGKLGDEGIQHARDLAEDIGAITDIGNDMLMHQRFGLSGKFAQQATNSFFLRTGLHAWTSATRTAILRVGQTFMRRLAKDVTEGRMRSQSARLLLGELGVPTDKIDDFSQWVMAQNDGYPMSDAVGADKGTAAQYRTALLRFTNQTIMAPKGVEKPRYASHPFGSIFYSLQSFLYSYQKNVLNRVGNLGLEAATKDGLNVADRLRLMQPMAMLPITLLGTMALNQLRDQVFNDPAKSPEQKERSPTQEIMLAMSRSGMTGTSDLLVNLFSGIRYRKDPATALIGPLWGGLSELISTAVNLSDDQNSPNTNTAERKFGRAVWNMMIAPTINLGLSLMPGTSLVTNLLAGLAMQAGNTPAARENLFVKPTFGAPAWQDEEQGGSRTRVTRATPSR